LREGGNPERSNDTSSGQGDAAPETQEECIARLTKMRVPEPAAKMKCTPRATSTTPTFVIPQRKAESKTSSTEETPLAKRIRAKCSGLDGIPLGLCQDREKKTYQRELAVLEFGPGCQDEQKDTPESKREEAVAKCVTTKAQEKKEQQSRSAAPANAAAAKGTGASSSSAPPKTALPKLTKREDALLLQLSSVDSGGGDRTRKRKELQMRLAEAQIGPCPDGQTMIQIDRFLEAIENSRSKLLGIRPFTVNMNSAVSSMKENISSILMDGTDVSLISFEDYRTMISKLNDALAKYATSDNGEYGVSQILKGLNSGAPQVDYVMNLTTAINKYLPLARNS
jgi:hypothetical protein